MNPKFKNLSKIKFWTEDEQLCFLKNFKAREATIFRLIMKNTRRRPVQNSKIYKIMDTITSASEKNKIQFVSGPVLEFSILGFSLQAISSWYLIPAIKFRSHLKSHIEKLRNSSNQLGKLRRNETSICVYLVN